MSASCTSNFNNRRPRHNSLIIDLVIAVCQHNIALPVHASRDCRGHSFAIRSNLRTRTDGSSDSDEARIELAILIQLLADRKTDGRARLYGTWLVGTKCQRWEGLEGKGWTAGRARLDEWCCKGIDLVEIKRVVKRLWEGRSLEPGAANVRAMARLDREDGPGGSQVCLVRNRGGSTEVRRYTNPFKDSCSGNKALRCSEPEVVGAFLYGRDTSSYRKESTQSSHSVERETKLTL